MYKNWNSCVWWRAPIFAIFITMKIMRLSACHRNYVTTDVSIRRSIRLWYDMLINICSSNEIVSSRKINTPLIDIYAILLLVTEVLRFFFNTEVLQFYFWCCDFRFDIPFSVKLYSSTLNGSHRKFLNRTVSLVLLFFFFVTKVFFFFNSLLL